jgi:hypothetical protein
MELMLNLRGDVWLLWGLLATFNTALMAGCSGRAGRSGILRRRSPRWYALFCARTKLSV